MNQENINMTSVGELNLRELSTFENYLYEDICNIDLELGKFVKQKIDLVEIKVKTYLEEMSQSRSRSKALSSLEAELEENQKLVIATGRVLVYFTFMNTNLGLFSRVKSFLFGYNLEKEWAKFLSETKDTPELQNTSFRLFFHLLKFV
jgi:hypothetical protein